MKNDKPSNKKIKETNASQRKLQKMRKQSGKKPKMHDTPSPNKGRKV